MLYINIFLPAALHFLHNNCTFWDWIVRAVQCSGFTKWPDPFTKKLPWIVVTFGQKMAMSVQWCIAICNVVFFNNFPSLSFLCASTIILHLLSIILHLPSIIEHYHLLFSIRIYKEQVREEFLLNILLSFYLLILYNEQVQKIDSRKRKFEIFIFIGWIWDDNDPNDGIGVSQYDATIRTNKLCILAQLVADDVLGIAQTILACWKSNWGRNFFFQIWAIFLGMAQAILPPLNLL